VPEPLLAPAAAPTGAAAAAACADKPLLLLSRLLSLP
jgi:hypothetical protein